MACTGCGNGISSLQPSRKNGGLYILQYIGAAPAVTVLGTKTGTAYSFGTGKLEFFVDYQDMTGLLADEQHGMDLRIKQ